MHIAEGFSITVDKSELLKTLAKNRDLHVAAHKEALSGYMQKTFATIIDIRNKLERDGPMPVQLDLQPPSSQQKVYDTVIGMLSMDVKPTVELTGSQYRSLVEDEWDWSRSWYQSNAQYGMTLASTAKAKGFL